MLSFFPKPYPEETFYSVIARYHKYSGNLNMTHTLNDLFSVNNIAINPDFASSINILLEKVPNEFLTAEEILYNHTLLPYYAAFVPTERVKAAEEIMMNRSNGESALTKLGINNSAIINYQHFKHCTECIKEDENKYGETFWHRLHQLPGNYVCPRHKRPLIQYNKQHYEINKNSFLGASNELIKNSTEYRIKDEHIEVFADIASESQWLLDNKIIMPHINYYRDQYIALLQNQEMATVNGSVSREKWMERFKDRYNGKILIRLQSEINNTSGKGWIEAILRKHQFLFHPIRHILVMKILSNNLIEFFSEEHQYQPFGKGPWPCLNAAHNHYEKHVITNVEIKRSSSKQPSGTFACECGFVYSRRGPDKERKDLYKRGRVVSFGQTWNNKLRELIALNITTAEIARILDVAPSTIKRKRININGETKTNFDEKNTLVKTRLMREEWKKLTKFNVGKTESQLSRIDRRLHYWLYHNDYTWLKNNPPAVKPTKALGRKVDWGQRDKKVYNEVYKIIENWKCNEGNKLKKITKYSIAKQTRRPYIILQKSDKIPKTMEFIESVLESSEDYHYRKLEWAFHTLLSEEKSISFSGLVKKAGINSGSISENIYVYAKNLVYQ